MEMDSREEIVARMRATIVDFLDQLSQVPNRKLKRSYGIVLRSSVSKEYYRYSAANALQFARQWRAFGQIYKLLKTNSYANKRDLFYEFKRLYRSQNLLDAAVAKASRFLGVSRCQLHITSTSKGFAIGPLQLVNEEITITFNITPVAIVEDLCEYEHVFCNAKAILIVEKDTIFQRLIKEGFTRQLPQVMMVTGRGFPDFATRGFVRWLVDLCDLPVYTLVDYDPYGMHIHFTYKHGSDKTRVEGRDLEIPETVLFGLTHARIQDLPIRDEQRVILNAKDKKRLELVRSLAERMKDDVLKEEVESMTTANYGVGIEALANIEPNYLMNRFVKPFFDSLFV